LGGDKIKPMTYSKTLTG